MAIEPEPLSDPFSTPEQQTRAARQGIWIFLATEVLFFGGPLAAYAVDRAWYGGAFTRAGNHLDLALGTLNTVLLLFSGFLTVVALEAFRAGAARRTALLLALSAALGTAFLGIKAFEWHHVAAEGLWPASSGVPDPQRLFLTLYFILTGLHALHLAIGVALLLLFAWALRRGRPFQVSENRLAVLGLYWHFVDIVWVFLFPLLYLAHRHA